MDKIIEVLKALADESRYKIITLLLTHDFCVGALAKRMDISEAAVSQHLQVLRKAGLVKGDKRGYYTHYYVDREAIKKAADKIIEMASQYPTGESGCLKHKTGQCQCIGKEENGNV